jgi:hypothetical protein
MLNMAKEQGKMVNGMRDQRYGELLFSFLPRTIKTEEGYKTVQAEIDRLVDQQTLSASGFF